VTAAGAAEPQERVPSAYTDPAESLHEKLAVRVAAPHVAVHPLNGPLTQVGVTVVVTVVVQLMPVWHGAVMVAGEVVGQELGAIVCPN